MRPTQKVLTSAVMALMCGPLIAADWGYTGQNTHYPPEKWGHLKGANLCNKGKQQSPINIATSEVAASSFLLHKEYAGNYVELTNNRHAIVAKAGRYIEIEMPGDGNKPSKHRYELVQFHFHTLSEHTVSRSPLDTPKHYDMEMHLVHVDKAGNLAVLGVFIEEGEYNDTLAEIFENLPSHGDEKDSHSNPKNSNPKSGTTMAALTANYEELLPNQGDLFVYSGSLTTPPCSEGVQWMIFVDPIQMSREQIQNYRLLFVENGMPFHTNRPIQRLNKRILQFGTID